MNIILRAPSSLRLLCLFAAKRVWVFAFCCCAISRSVFAADLSWLPSDLPPLPTTGPALCPRDYLTPAQGAEVLDAAKAHFKDRDSWNAYADLLRRKIQEGAALAPWPKKTPLNPVIERRREFDGYSVENVRLETVPGVFACGNLYRPLKANGPCPAVLTTHGHTAPIKTPEDWAKHGRFHESVQRRAATLARMGAVVLTIDMFGYGDSFTQFGPDAHRRPDAMTFQLWNNIRALDFLASLDGVDPKRLAVTGESGGGTQTMLLTAVDDRVSVSVPVVMASSYFFGGCPCESGRPIHRSAEHFASNAMIATLAAPRPMLLVSDGKDWTKYTPQVEFPFAQAIYRLFGKESAVANVHLPDEGHDYGPSKRQAMYRFMAERLGLNDNAARAADDAFDESKVTLENPEAMRVFTGELPKHACRTVSEAVTALQALQR
ncbi:MAG TPA: prolyl oligopeptidase family serine peptidase [Opitutaceae bacterium]|nr:prolyl oligopeptidase family serine peptidase [Opitutaceae bacterium]